MRDAFNIFGTAEAKGGATAVVFAPDVIKTTGDDKIGHVGNVPDISVTFSPVGDFTSADEFTPVVYHCDTADGEFTECVRGFAVKAPTKATVVTVNLPRSHKPYLKAGFIPSSSGTFSASKVEAWIGLGEHDTALGEYYN